MKHGSPRPVGLVGPVVDASVLFEEHVDEALETSAFRWKGGQIGSQLVTGLYHTSLDVPPAA